MQMPTKIPTYKTWQFTPIKSQYCCLIAAEDAEKMKNALATLGCVAIDDTQTSAGKAPEGFIGCFVGVAEVKRLGLADLFEGKNAARDRS